MLISRAITVTNCGDVWQKKTNSGDDIKKIHM